MVSMRLHPWLQLDPRTPETIFYSFPPIDQRSIRPSIIAHITEDSFCLDENIGVFLTPVSPSFAIANLKPGRLDKSKAATVTKLQARTRRELLPCFISYFADVVYFEATSLQNACYLASEWSRACSITRDFMPVAAFRILYHDDHMNKLEQRLKERLSYAFDYHNYFVRVVLLPAEHFNIQESVVLQSQACAVRRLRAKKSLHWTWHILRHLGHGMARQLATVTELKYINYVNAFEEMRLPHSLLYLEDKLRKYWARWFARDSRILSTCNSRFMILAHCLGLDLSTYYHGFDSTTAFKIRYKHTISLACQDYSPEGADIFSAIEKATIKTALVYTKMKPAEKKDLHGQFLKKQWHTFRQFKSQDICYSCFIRPYEYRLPCHCSVCAYCCSNLGMIENAPTLHRFDACPLCNIKFDKHARIRVPPPTAGYRLLELDGGGVRGIIQILTLLNIQKRLGLPLGMFIDLATGTSAGGINALTIGLLEWTLEQCNTNFQVLAEKIFPQPSILPRFVTKFLQAVKVLLFDGIYLPAGPTFRSTVGDTELRGSRASLSHTSPYEQMKVAVTATSASGSSVILTTYGKNFHTTPHFYTWLQGQECKELGKLRVWQAAEITSAAPFYFPAVKIDNYILQDGIETPFYHSRCEGRNLWPYKATHDFIISLGCGVTKASTINGTNAISRCLNITNEFLKAKRTFDQHQSFHSSYDNFFRIDPVLDLDNVDLDDSSKILDLSKEVEGLFRTDNSALREIQSLPWMMLSSLFYFELLNISSISGADPLMKCIGQIRCRYSDNTQVQSFFKTRYKGKVITIGGERFPLQGTEPIPVTFKIESWYQQINITLGVEGASASISGFPESISNIFAQQVAATEVMPSTKDHVQIRRKRVMKQCEEYSLKRPKRFSTHFAWSL